MPDIPQEAVTGQRKPRLVGGWVHLCVSDLRSGPRDDCPNPLHDYPLPSGYGDASDTAERRLRYRWRNKKCPDCGLYGWTPGDPTGDPCDERVPVPHEEAGTA